MSARRLGAALAALDDTTGAYLMPTTLRNAGVVVRDEPMPLRSQIEINAGFHLNTHLKQLEALRS
jgi:hypothetical protein